MKHFSSDKTGFSLIELLVVVVVIGILAAIAMQAMNVTVEDIRRTRTEREMEMLASAIVGDPAITNGGVRSDFGYFGDIGAFPANLQALYQNPGSYATWDGPYLPPGFSQDNTGFKTDEWGTAYSYSGGVTITSSGSGSTITKKIADATSDYLLNQLKGTIKDVNDSLPGSTYDDSVDIKITIPDGSGGTVTKTYHPDSTGVFTLDSLPVGKHALRIIYTPNVDTLFRYVTILPRHRSSTANEYLFAATHFSGISSCNPDTLRPQGVGTATGLVTDGCSSNWQCVDETSADDDATYVKSSGTSYGTDTYNTANPAGTSCTVNSVTIHIRARRFVKTAYAKVVLRTYGTEYEGSEETLGNSYADYSHQWTTNPSTGAAWTISEVENMEIGVRLRTTKSTHPARCTQVWAVVEYSS